MKGGKEMAHAIENPMVMYHEQAERPNFAKYIDALDTVYNRLTKIHNRIEDAALPDSERDRILEKFDDVEIAFLDLIHMIDDL